MRLINADELIKDRVENDPVRIAAECAPTAFDKEKVIKEIRNVPHGYYNVDTENEIIGIVEKGRMD